MLTETKLGYIAGILDGEGTICIVRYEDKGKNLRYMPKISIINSSGALMDYLKDAIPYGHIKPLGNGIFHFDIKNSKHVDFIKMLLPYLVIKKEQALIIIDFLTNGKKAGRNPNGGRGLYLPTGEQDRRAELWARMKVLNGRKTIPYKSKRLQRLSEMTPQGEATV